MKRCLLLCVVALLALSSLAFGQRRPWDTSNTTPFAEIYGGFTINHSDFGQQVDPLTGLVSGSKTYFNQPGFVFNFGYNALRNLRLVADFGGQYKGTDIFDPNTGAKISTSNYQIMFGPEFVWRGSDRVTPFVHGLGGWTTRHYNVPTGQVICTGFSCSNQKTTLVSDSGGALALGGGMDIRLTQNIRWRAVEFDYIRTHMSRNTPNFAIDTSFLPVLTNWQTNYRFSTGVVFRIGEKK